MTEKVKLKKSNLESTTESSTGTGDYVVGDFPQMTVPQVTHPTAVPAIFSNPAPNAFLATNMPAGMYPTNVVELPSQGLLYSETSPLRQGRVEVKFMTTKEENILTTESYIRSGIVVDKFLESMVVSPKFNFDELLVGDKDAILIASRIYGHGEIYPITVTTPSGNTQTANVDLTTLTNKELDWTKLKRSSTGNFIYEFTNRAGNYTLEFKFLTVADNKKIDEALKKYRKVGAADRQVTTRLEHIITAVNGNSDPNYIKLFVENEFLSKDYRAFRDYVASVTPGVNLEIDLVDEVTGEPFRHNVSFGPDFLWPDARI